MGARERGCRAIASARPSNVERLAAAGLFVVLTGAVLLFTSTARAAQAPVGAHQPSETKAAPTSTPSASEPKKTKATASIAWGRVPSAEQKTLAPLESEWAKLPGTQQRRLLGAAKHYPNLTPVEQERFRERLKAWSALTPEQRSAARDKYKTLTSLPSAKQEEIKARWQHDKQPDKNAKDSAAEPAAK